RTRHRRRRVRRFGRSRHRRVGADECAERAGGQRGSDRTLGAGARRRGAAAQNRRMTTVADDGVLIVGAGLTGLSAAYHLGTHPYVLLEREDHVGGLCRSVRDGGFTFDYTGHLLHMKRSEVRSLVFRLLGEHSFAKIERRSGIYSHGTYTEY